MKENIRKEKRLLTQAEKEVIKNGYNRLGTTETIKFCVIVCAGVLVLSVILYFLVQYVAGGEFWFKVAVGCFGGLNLIMVIVLFDAWIHMGRFIKLIEKDELYVTEAVYKGTNRYQTIFLDMYKNGRIRQCDVNESLREPIKTGDKVVLIEKIGTDVVL